MRDYIPEGKEGSATQDRKFRYDYVPETGILPEPEPERINPEPPEGAPLLAHDYVPERLVESAGDRAAARAAARAVAEGPPVLIEGAGSIVEISAPLAPEALPTPEPEPAPSRKSRATPEARIAIPPGWEQTGTDADGQPLLKKIKGRKGGEVEYEEEEVPLDAVLEQALPEKKRIGRPPKERQP